MKKLMFGLAVLGAAATLSAAEITYSSFSFKTVGPDTYADGTTVLDGECYALVWSADGVFEGIKADGTPTDAADKVLAVLPCAKGGACPEQYIEIANTLKFGEKFAIDGTFGVLLLDTRKFGEAGQVTVGKKNAINKTAPAIVSVKAEQTTIGAVASSETTVAATGTTELPADVEDPVITDINVGTDFVTITADKTSPFANYAIQAGPTTAAEGFTGAPKAGNGKITLVIERPAGNSAFFKIIRK